MTTPNHNNHVNRTVGPRRRPQGTNTPAAPGAPVTPASPQARSVSSRTGPFGNGPAPVQPRRQRSTPPVTSAVPTAAPVTAPQSAPRPARQQPPRQSSAPVTTPQSVVTPAAKTTNNVTSSAKNSTPTAPASSPSADGMSAVEIFLCALPVAMILVAVGMKWYKAVLFGTEEWSLFGVEGFKYGWVIVVISGLTLLAVFTADTRQEAGSASLGGGAALFIATVVTLFAKGWILGGDFVDEPEATNFVHMEGGFWLALVISVAMLCAPLYSKNK